jgi:8-oxo-dGTP pyrophosphatase MutT (NUDIX family)
MPPAPASSLLSLMIRAASARVLLLRRPGGGEQWGFPNTTLEPHETPAFAARTLAANHLGLTALELGGIERVPGHPPYATHWLVRASVPQEALAHPPHRWVRPAELDQHALDSVGAALARRLVEITRPESESLDE